MADLPAVLPGNGLYPATYSDLIRYVLATDEINHGSVALKGLT
jgi:hypothetical protein